jgi:hypothetical protein
MLDALVDFGIPDKRLGLFFPMLAVKNSGRR